MTSSASPIRALDCAHLRLRRAEIITSATEGGWPLTVSLERFLDVIERVEPGPQGALR